MNRIQCAPLCYNLLSPRQTRLHFRHFRNMSSIALARVYQQSFETHPYGTLAVTNGAFNALGDIVAQITEKAVRLAGLYSAAAVVSH